MQQNLILNILPFTHPLKEVSFACYLTKKEPHYCPIHKDDIKGFVSSLKFDNFKQT